MKNLTRFRPQLAASVAACVVFVSFGGDLHALAPPGHFTLGTGELAGTVLDNATGLTWQRGVAMGVQSHTESATYCASLVLGGSAAKRGEWRLPTVLELRSIVDERVSPPGPTIDPAAFPDAPATGFWTATPVAGSLAFRWLVSFVDGMAAEEDAANRHSARCVR